jgi:hypothetical protein
VPHERHDLGFLEISSDDQGGFKDVLLEVEDMPVGMERELVGMQTGHTAKVEEERTTSTSTSQVKTRGGSSTTRTSMSNAGIGASTLSKRSGSRSGKAKARVKAKGLGTTGASDLLSWRKKTTATW